MCHHRLTLAPLAGPNTYAWAWSTRGQRCSRMLVELTRAEARYVRRGALRGVDARRRDVDGVRHGNILEDCIIWTDYSGKKLDLNLNLSITCSPLKWSSES